MPEDEISRGIEGMALVIDERSEMGYVGLTPWFDSEPWRSVAHQDRAIDLEKAGPERPARQPLQPPELPQPRQPRQPPQPPQPPQRPQPGFDLDR